MHGLIFNNISAIVGIHYNLQILSTAKDKEGTEDGAIDDAIVGYADGVLLS